MEVTNTGIGNLIYETSFAMPGSTSGRYAARLYRPIIFALATTIIILTGVTYAAHGQWIAPLLFLAVAGYTSLFVVRMRMTPTLEARYYGVASQFVRGMLSLVGVALMSATLFYYGIVDHELWLLYVLSTLIVSEHNSSRAVRFALLMVGIAILATPYFMLVLLGTWTVTDYFNDLLPRLLIETIGVLLITFVSHYLIRNIQGRQIAVDEHRHWAEEVAKLVLALDKPGDQLREVVGLVEGLTGATVALWIVRLPDGCLTDGSGNRPPSAVIEAAESGQPRLALRQKPSVPYGRPKALLTKTWHGLYRLLARDAVFLLPVTREVSLAPDIFAEVIIPIVRPDARIIAVLDVAYGAPEPDELTLHRHYLRLKDFVGYAQLIIVNATRVARIQQEERLNEPLRTLTTTSQIANQVATDLVEVTGFDHAAVWLVDHDSQVMRCAAQIGAPWAYTLNLPLRASKLSLVAMTLREGYTICQGSGPDEGLSRRLRQRHRLDERRRMFVPIPVTGSPDAVYPAIGVLEVGFRPDRKPQILPSLAQLLEAYAVKIGFALSGAESLSLERRFNQSLSALLDSSRQFMTRASYFTTRDMTHLIGEAASQFLGADIVMVYTLDEEAGDLGLAYAGPHQASILGHKPLIVTLNNNILSLLHHTHASYFAPDAREDPNLVGSSVDAGSSQYRTFTQRQNIKSFAGVRLSGISGETHGFLCLNFRTRHDFPDQERKLLQLFALQAGVALEEARYQTQTRDLLQARERVALAAELHHHMSQNLYALRMYANTTAHISGRYQDENLRVCARQVVELAARSQVALGNMLSSLHQLPDSFTDFLQELETHIAIRARFHSTPTIHLAHRIECVVTKQVQFYLFRIAIEALANSIRHARAQTVTISYTVSRDGAVDLTIQDDGLGFLEGPEAGGYGQDAMRYFAGKIRARLGVEHCEGSGTNVLVHFQPYNA